jgi:hypothetical protein
MPAKSKAQFRAMHAAAHGKSTLGIPKSVGKEFTSYHQSPKGLPERLGKLAKLRKAKKK